MLNGEQLDARHDRRRSPRPGADARLRRPRAVRPRVGGRCGGRQRGAARSPLTAPIAETMQGGYLQVGYNVLSQVSTTRRADAVCPLRAASTRRIACRQGSSRDLARDGDFKTLGVEVKPIPNVVVKADYQWITNAANTGRNQVNVNLGYSF